MLKPLLLTLLAAEASAAAIPGTGSEASSTETSTVVDSPSINTHYYPPSLAFPNPLFPGISGVRDLFASETKSAKDAVPGVTFASDYPNPKKLQRRAAALPPAVASSTYLANVTDPFLDRDSCGSTRIAGRNFWVCRDTDTWNTTQQKDVLPIVQNTCAWTNWTTTGGPVITPAGQAPLGAGSNGNNSILQMFGQPNNTNNVNPYYPLAADMCPSAGVCSDGSRWVYWPNSPPLITTNQSTGSQSATGYTWVDKKHISGLTQLNPNPPYTLFRTNWNANNNPGNSFPNTTVVADQFYPAGEIGFGNYGNLIRNGYAYLYGQNNASQTILARVPPASIENRTAYQYWNNNASTWTGVVPNINNTNYTIPNCGGGGQGTFYFSSYYGQYLWIGQSSQDFSADFYLSYAPQPQGPWSSLQLIFQGISAQGSFVGAYSLQAHPYMLKSNTASENGIYLTWTIPENSTSQGNGSYITPLVYLTFK